MKPVRHVARRSRRTGIAARGPGQPTDDDAVGEGVASATEASRKITVTRCGHI